MSASRALWLRSLTRVLGSSSFRNARPRKDAGLQFSKGFVRENRHTRQRLKTLLKKNQTPKRYRPKSKAYIRRRPERTRLKASQNKTT